MLKVKKGIHFALNGTSSFSFETRGEILSDFLGNIHTLTAGLDCWTNSRSYQPAMFLLMLTEWYVCTCILTCSADIEHTYLYLLRPKAPVPAFSHLESCYRAKDETKAKPPEVTQYVPPTSRNKTAKEIITCFSAELM